MLRLVGAVDHECSFEYPARDTQFVALRAPTNALPAKDGSQQRFSGLFELAHPFVVASAACGARCEPKRTRVRLRSPMLALKVESVLTRATKGFGDPFSEDVLLATSHHAAESADPAILHSADDAGPAPIRPARACPRALWRASAMSANLITDERRVARGVPGAGNPCVGAVQEVESKTTPLSLLRGADSC
jgi:hypothetical protein